MSTPPFARSASLILVRHGATVWNEEGRLQGRQDVELSDLGRDQAEAVAAALADSGAVKVVSSPLRRALETARAIAARLGVEVEQDAALVERGFGPLEGKTRDELASLGPVRTLEGPGIEPVAELTARACAALERQARAHIGARVVVVSHGACLGAFLRAIDPNGRYSLVNAGISEIVYAPNVEPQWRILSADRTEHLQ